VAQGKDRLRELAKKFPTEIVEKQEAIRIALVGVDTAQLVTVVAALKQAILPRMWSPESALSPARAAEENIEYGRYLTVHLMDNEINRRLTNNSETE
jgi:hypothetical protein